MRKIVIDSSSASIKHLVDCDNKFTVLYRLIGKISYQLNNKPFAFIVETIIGQMLSNKVADIFVDRLIEICYTGRIDIASIQKLSIIELRSIGISNKKAQYILDFSMNYNPADYSLKKLSSLTNEEIIKQVTTHKGLGIWSAKMFLLFVLGREDILPYEDVAFLQAFVWYYELDSIPKAEEIKTICHKWSPYTSIAARYLYKALDNGFTKRPFASYCLQ
jgi:DNA-3-methyladenine glycosylase II